MVHSVELVFDTATEAIIRGSWAELAAAGIASPATSARPHATLAVAERIDAQVDELLAGLTDRLPLPCSIGAPLIFGRNRAVLARLLVPSADLLALHAEVYTRCRPHLAPAPMPHTEPGQWTAHVTLARRVTPDQLARAVPIAGRPATISGSIVGLRRWDGNQRIEHPIG